MTDAALIWSSNRLEADIALAPDGWDLASDDGLETAVTISLFTDRRASEDELPDGESDRRGSWQDAIDDDGDEIGSLLWLLDREKATAEVAVKAEHYVREALAWMTADGIAEAVDVVSEIAGECLALDVGVRLPDGRHLEYSYSLGGADAV